MSGSVSLSHVRTPAKCRHGPWMLVASARPGPLVQSCGSPRLCPSAPPVPFCPRLCPSVPACALLSPPAPFCPRLHSRARREAQGRTRPLLSFLLSLMSKAGGAAPGSPFAVKNRFNRYLHLYVADTERSGRVKRTLSKSCSRVQHKAQRAGRRRARARSCPSCGSGSGEVPAQDGVPVGLLRRALGDRPGPG